VRKKVPPPRNTSKMPLTGLSYLALGVVVATVPLTAWMVFGLGFDRQWMTSIAAVAFSVGLNIFFVEPLARWPKDRPVLSSTSVGHGDISRTISRFSLQQLEEASLRYLWTSTVIHLTWELSWLLVRHMLPLWRDSVIGWVWYVYIDSGDSRYLTQPTDLVAIEILSVLNGCLGLYCLWNLHTLERRSKPTSSEFNNGMPGRKHPMIPQLQLGLLVMAAVHLYSASYYFLSEILEGCLHCDQGSAFNVFFSFFLANIPWVYMPFVVGRWTLLKLFRV
jgi:hypothetical protein